MQRFIRRLSCGMLFGAILAFWMKPDEELEDPADGERTTTPARSPAPSPAG